MRGGQRFVPPAQIGLIKKYQFSYRWFTTHYYSVEKLFSAHRLGHSVFTERKIINKVFTILSWDTIHKILRPERYITPQGSGHNNFSYVV